MKILQNKKKMAVGNSDIFNLHMTAAKYIWKNSILWKNINKIDIFFIILGVIAITRLKKLFLNILKIIPFN